jgi:hypothetical protein
MYSIQDLKNDLIGAIHNTTENQITNLNGVIDRAARQLLLDCDPQETKRTLEFVNPIFNSVFDYPIAPDVKGNALIDIRPQVRRIPRDIWTQAYNQEFDVAKENLYASEDMFTLNFNSGLKTIRINAPFLNPPVIINQADNLTNNGAWVNSYAGSATNLRIDNTNFVAGTGALTFDYIGSGGPEIMNSTMTPVDLSLVENQSRIFCWIYIPTNASNVLSLEIDFGSNPNDGWDSGVISTTNEGTAFQNGWNLIGFDWSSTTPFGTPNSSAINYFQIYFQLAVDAPITGLKVNGIDSILGTILEYEFYSKYLFRDAITGAFQEKVTDDSNLVNLDTESYNLLFNLTTFLAVQQQQGLDAMFYDGNFFGEAYQDSLAKYKARYKSELQKPQSAYYRMPPRGYNRVIGRGFNR